MVYLVDLNLPKFAQKYSKFAQNSSKFAQKLSKSAIFRRILAKETKLNMHYKQLIFRILFCEHHYLYIHSCARICVDDTRNVWDDLPSERDAYGMSNFQDKNVRQNFSARKRKTKLSERDSCCVKTISHPHLVQQVNFGKVFFIYSYRFDTIRNRK